LVGVAASASEWTTDSLALAATGIGKRYDDMTGGFINATKALSVDVY
jgi:hypothetical protein